MTEVKPETNGTPSELPKLEAANGNGIAEEKMVTADSTADEPLKKEASVEADPIEMDTTEA